MHYVRLFYRSMLVQAFYINRQERILLMQMDRTEAVTYLKELMNLCDELSPSCVSFENFNDNQSVGYRVIIKGTIQESDRQKLREIAKKHSLVVQEDVGGVVIYKAKEQLAP
jgi:hypothetical protein